MTISSNTGWTGLDRSSTGRFAPGLKLNDGSGGGLAALFDVGFEVMVSSAGGSFSVSLSILPGLKVNGGGDIVGFLECLRV